MSERNPGSNQPAGQQPPAGQPPNPDPEPASDASSEESDVSITEKWNDIRDRNVPIAELLSDDELRERIKRLLDYHGLLSHEFSRAFSFLVGIPINEFHHYPHVADPVRPRDPNLNRTQQYQQAVAARGDPLQMNPMQEQYRELLRLRIAASCFLTPQLQGLLA
jgi:hypothetical protein